MAEDREATRVLDALAAYLAEVDTTRAVRKAFLAGVAVGRCLGRARKLSTGSTGRVADEARAVGFHLSPLTDPPTPTSYVQDPSLDLNPDPDLKSIERANLGARATLELVAPPVTPPPRAARAVILPAQFTLTAERRAFAEVGGLNPGLEFGWFKDHHRAKGSRFVDWEAAWRTWCRRAARFGRGTGPQ